jgi:hypothetical protein
MKVSLETSKIKFSSIKWENFLENLEISQNIWDQSRKIFKNFAS